MIEMLPNRAGLASLSLLVFLLCMIAVMGEHSKIRVGQFASATAVARSVRGNKRSRCAVAGREVRGSRLRTSSLPSFMYCFRLSAYEAQQWKPNDGEELLVPDILSQDETTFFPEAIRDQRQSTGRLKTGVPSPDTLAPTELTKL